MRHTTSLLVLGALLVGATAFGYGTGFSVDGVPSAEARDRDRDDPRHDDRSDRRRADRDDRRHEPSVRGIRNRPGREHRPWRRLPVRGVRSIDGSGNNPRDEEMGAAGIPLTRIAKPDYYDGNSEMAGGHRPGARAVSNAIADQAGSMPNRLGASDWLWQWGQFLDHDIDLTDAALPPEAAPIPVPAGDPFFDPHWTGTQIIPLSRSLYVPGSSPRQQINEITAWIDASNVYGSDEERASALRTNDGTGRLKTSPGNFLPFNTDGLPNAGGPSDTLFLAGDVRANEQAGLTAVHTLFVREHNRLAEEYRKRHRHWSGERIYQKARKMVGAYMQAITYNEFLPALLGKRAVPRYRGYDPRVDARIMNAFSTGAYRFGHSALNTTLRRIDKHGETIVHGHLELRDAFFAPHAILNEGGIDPILRGLTSQRAQTVDPFVVDDVRNFLFGPPGAGGFDLASLNIQRGRDHGLPSYNDMCEAMGMPRAVSWADISSDAQIRFRLASVYDSPDDVDFWVGGLSEDPMPGAHVGRLFYHVILKQFLALRDGDRFWYERDLSRDELREVNRTKLSDIIRRNTGIGHEIPDDVFHVKHRGHRKHGHGRR